MCAPSSGEHSLGHVHAHDVQAVLGEKGRHAARSATYVCDWTCRTIFDQLDKCHQK